MRRTILTLLTLVTVAGPAAAQKEKVSFQSVRVGFQPGPKEAVFPEGIDPTNMRPQFLFKSGAWVPIVVDVMCTDKYTLKEDGPVTVSVQVLDSDETQNTFAVQLPPFDQQTLKASAIVYARPGTRYGEFTINLTNTKGRQFTKEAQPSAASLTAGQTLYLVLGSRVPGMRLPGNKNASNVRSEVGIIPRAADMPPNWFGYNSADVVVLSTGDRNFMTDLAANQDRCRALAEWVRRGGNLIVTLGTNRDTFVGDSLGELAKVLPLVVEGKPYTVTQLPLAWKDGTRFGNQPLRPARGTDGIELTRFAPRPADEHRSYFSLMDGPTESGGSPLVAQGAFGLGRVTCVAFDLDAQPFGDYTPSGLHWEKLLTQSGPRPKQVSKNQYMG